MNDYTFFEKHMPYRVERNGNQVVVKNRLYEPLFTGLLPDRMDANNTMKSFACPERDCLFERKDYCTCYLYNSNVNVNDDAVLDAYMKRLSKLHIFLSKLEPTESAKESPENIRYVLKLAKMTLDEVEDRFEEFLHDNSKYVEAHGDKHYEQVYFNNIPIKKDYTLSMNVVNKEVEAFSIFGPADPTCPSQD